MQVRISQTFGQIGIQQKAGLVHIKSRHADLNLHVKPEKLEVDIQGPFLDIDQADTWESMGYSSFVRFQKLVAEQGYNIALDGIERMVREGDRMADLPEAENAIPAIAEAAAWPEKDYNVGLIPSEKPKITFSGGINIRYNPAEVQVNAKAKSAEIWAERPEVEVYLRVDPAVDFSVTGKNLDLLG